MFVGNLQSMRVRWQQGHKMNVWKKWTKKKKKKKKEKMIKDSPVSAYGK